MVDISWGAIEEAYKVKIRTNSSSDFNTVLSCIKTVPLMSRTYDAETKTWWIKDICLDTLTLSLKACKIPYTISLLKPENAKTSSAVSLNSKLDTSIITFVKLLPKAVAEKTFKLAMIELHPDKNSNANAHNQAAALSEAWAYIKKELYHD